MIRKANEQDIPALGRIFCLGWQGGYTGILPKTYLDTLTPEGCAPKKAPSNILLCERDGEAVGLIGIGPARDHGVDGTVGELRAIYVLPSHFRRGIGRELFDAGTDALRKQGFASFYLWVLEKNARARAFYERMGMRASDETKTDIIAGEAFTERKYYGTL